MVAEVQPRSSCDKCALDGPFSELVMRTIFVSLVAGFLCIYSAVVLSESEYAIEPMKDNVYRFTAGNYRSVFMVTDEGVFVTDPINRQAARWLLSELESRFNQPVKYMAYSHNHVDHVLGGEVFAEAGAVVVAQELAAEDIAWTQVPTAPAEITFEDFLDVELGSSTVALRYHGTNNGRGSVSMRFLPANVLYVVDWIVLGRMPYKNLIGYDIHGMIRSTEAVLAGPDFDLFVGGHGQSGKREDVERYLAYLKALYAAVRDGMLQGKTLDTLKAEIQLEEFKDLPMYREWLPLNVEGVYKTLVETSYFNFRPDIDADF